MLIQIDAQPLGSALSLLAQQTGLRLPVAPELMAGKTASAVKGMLTYDAALAQLLMRLGVLGERPLLDTLFSVNVITSELIDSMGVTDLKTWTRVDPALAPSFSGIGYYNAVSIRGLPLNNWTNFYRNGLLFADQAKSPFEI